MPRGMQNKFRTYNRCPQRDPILVREIRHSHVKGRGRVHSGLLIKVLWEGVGLGLDLEFWMRMGKEEEEECFRHQEWHEQKQRLEGARHVQKG